jgi:two-component system response regulator VanR
MNGYIVKPLDINKLIEILESLFKNYSNKIKFKNYIYDFDTLELVDDKERKIPLGKKENTLLKTFLLNKNRVLSREELEFEIWHEPLESDTTLKNLIASLRKKIGKEMIVNESRIGWRIKID